VLPVASDVDAPHAVLPEIPAVIESDWEVLRELPFSLLREAVPPSGRKLLASLAPRPSDAESLAEFEADSDVLSPTVLV
jgi:hypothetical protein